MNIVMKSGPEVKAITPDISAKSIAEPKAGAEDVPAIILEGRSLDEAETE